MVFLFFLPDEGVSENLHIVLCRLIKKNNKKKPFLSKLLCVLIILLCYDRQTHKQTDRRAERGGTDRDRERVTERMGRGRETETQT